MHRKKEHPAGSPPFLLMSSTCHYTRHLQGCHCSEVWLATNQSSIKVYLWPQFHRQTCPLLPNGWFLTLCHNEIRDLTAKLMSEVCHNVCVEPHLQPITGENLNGASAITDDGAILDIAVSGFWGGQRE